MRPIRLLLVDDEARFVTTLGKRLQARGLEVEGAHSGGEALAALASRPIDVVLLDVKMPEMDGVETLRAIKQRHPDVQVIMLSGHACVNAAVEGIRLGALEYLIKPIDIDDLLDKLEMAFERKLLHEEEREQAGAERQATTQPATRSARPLATPPATGSETQPQARTESAATPPGAADSRPDTRRA